MVDFQDGAKQIQHLGFGRRTVAEVLAHGLGQHILVTLDLAPQGLQIRYALTGRGTGVCQCSGLLRGKQAGHARVGRFEPLPRFGDLVHAGSW